MPTLYFQQNNACVASVEAELGANVMEVAVDEGLDIEALCGGCLACATCHVIVKDVDRFDQLPPRSEDEEGMLDLAQGVTSTSRLSCQLTVTQEMDGIVFVLPEEG